MEAAVDAIVVIEEDGRIVAFSRAAQRMFGYSERSILGKPVTTLMPEPYRTEHASYLARYQSTRQAHIIGIGREVEAMRQDGTTFPIWLSVGEASSDSGVRYVGILRDLTDEREAEHERHALEVRLAHVSRLSLLGEMAAGIAHEINQPLSAITNFAQAAKHVLERDDVDREMLSEACTGISEQVHRAGEVIRNLRKFVKTREIEKNRLDLRELIRGVLSLVHADASHAGVAVEIEFAEDLPEISGNAVQLQQVLLNLTRNAVDAMRDRKNRTKQMSIKTGYGTDGFVQFQVCDRGTGISANLGDAIFHPFVTTKSDGLGVGLAISRSIVEAHGGTLSYEPRPEGGSIFTVALPAVEAS